MITTQADLSAWLAGLRRDWCDAAPPWGDLVALLRKARTHREAFEEEWALPCSGSFARRGELIGLLRELESACEAGHREAAGTLWGRTAAAYYAREPAHE